VGHPIVLCPFDSKALLIVLPSVLLHGQTTGIVCLITRLFNSSLRILSFPILSPAWIMLCLEREMGKIYVRPWSWRKYIRLKHGCTCTRLHGVTDGRQYSSSLEMYMLDRKRHMKGSQCGIWHRVDW
jgi:hypothetical protein